MLAKDLIAVLADMVARQENLEVYVAAEMLLVPTAVEVWDAPHFDVPTVVILANDA